MSYDIRLLDPVTRETVEVEAPHLMQGGTYALGGTTELWLNVTYNYGRHYRRVMGEEGLRRMPVGGSRKLHQQRVQRHRRPHREA
nr:MAG TPA: hypothetical protein [Caudoviricetes sp.]